MLSGVRLEENERQLAAELRPGSPTAWLVDVNQGRQRVRTHRGQRTQNGGRGGQQGYKAKGELTVSTSVCDSVCCALVYVYFCVEVSIFLASYASFTFDGLFFVLLSDTCFTIVL